MSAATTTGSATRPEIRLSVFAVAALVLVAAIAGIVLGGAFHSEPAPPAKPRPATAIASAGLRLELPAGWAGGAAGTLPSFDRLLWLRDATAGARAAVALLPAASPTLLPAGLQASGAPQVVELGHGRRAWRYPVLRSASVPLAVYAMPTTKGIATVGCLGSGARAERACRALAAALAVPGARWLEPGGSAAFFSLLSTTVARLDAARAKGGRALAAASRPTAQAIAADALARAHRAAATELVPSSSNGDVLASATASDLLEAAGAYSVLAEAARNRAARPYADARRAVLSADRALRASLARDMKALDAAGSRAATAASP